MTWIKAVRLLSTFAGGKMEECRAKTNFGFGGRIGNCPKRDRLRHEAGEIPKRRNCRRSRLERPAAWRR